MAKLLTFLAALAAFAAMLVLSAIDVLELKPAGTADQLLNLGATQELNCSVNATEQSAKIDWVVPTMDGVIRRDETAISSSNQMLKSSLKIEKFTEANAGEYKCVLIKNTLVVSEAVTQLKAVTEIKTEPTFVLGSKTASLSCSIKFDDQVPVSQIMWLKQVEQNKEPVNARRDRDRFDIFADNNTLVIKNPIRDDSGMYIARFTMDGRSDVYDCNVQYKAGPLVLDFEKSKNLIEGDDLDLRCIVKGYPYSTITWYKDNEVFNISSEDIGRIMLKELYGYQNAHLFIRHTQYSDAGDYTCEAFSPQFPNDTSSKTITVRVKDKLAALWPFLGIVGEVILLCTIIFIYEKRRSKQVQLDDQAFREIDGSAVDKKEGLRHRNTNNPTA